MYQIHKRESVSLVFERLLTWVTSICTVIRNRKIVWKHRPYWWYFRLNLKYLGWPYRAYFKIAKNGDFREELLLSTSCCYGLVAMASDAVPKIATQEYRKFSLCVIICWIAKIYLSTNCEKGLVPRTPPT